MSEINESFESLSKEQQYILTKIYKEYIHCIDLGYSAKQCNHFDNAASLHNKLFNDIHYDDFVDHCRALKENDFISGAPASIIKITNKTISYFLK